MTNVRSYTDIELIKRVESLDTFKGWKKGIYDFWVRSEEDEPDRFDDKGYTFECETDGKRPKFIMVSSGTTNAGLGGLKGFKRYNREGCAVLKSDFLVYNSHKYGKHKGKYPAYIQAKGFPYYRDGDMDNKAEELGRIYTDIIGANCHKAGKNSTIVGDWSWACLVRNVETQYDKWMEFMNKRLLSVVILKEF
jgi:hypothetical protein